MTRRVRQVVRMLLHLAVPSVGAAAPLAVVPAVTATSGAAGWAAVAVGTSIGVAGAVVAELGWSIVGPQAVAREASATARSLIFTTVLASRLAAVTVVLPVAVVVTSLTAGEHRAAAALVTAGVVLGALSPAWWFIGRGRPGLLLCCETLPRVVALLGAALALTLGAPLGAYGIALVASAVVSFVLAPRLDPDLRLPRLHDYRRVPAALREQGVLVLGRAVTTSYKSLPAALLGAAAPGAVAVFAAVDRPARLGLQVLMSVPDRLQTWVAVPDEATSRRRTRTSFVVNGLLGLGAGAVFAVALPLVAPVLFAGAVTVPTPTVLWGAALVAVICTSRGAGLALVTARRAGHTTSAAAAAALVGVPGVILLGRVHGADGALAALVAAEAVGALVQVVVLLRGRSGRAVLPALAPPATAASGGPS